MVAAVPAMLRAAALIVHVLPASVLATKSSHPASGNSNLVCDFEIHYNRWMEGFEPSEYRHNEDKHGQVHCLDACCRDPSCLGLTLESNLESQCYRYAHLPAGVQDGGVPLATFLAGERVSEWSVFVKRLRPASASVAPAVRGANQATPLQLAPPALTPELQAAVAARPRRLQPLVSREEALDGHLRGLGGMPRNPKCSWQVHYDVWIRTFDEGEYAHDDTVGAHVHCLEKCCEDPTCLGLALQSTELHQCYKYSHMPAVRGHGQRLGGGQWLRHRRPKWSVMIKAAATAAAAPPAHARHSPVNAPSALVVPKAAGTSSLDNPAEIQVGVNWSSMLRWIAIAAAAATSIAFVMGEYAAQINRRAVFTELKLRGKSPYNPECTPLRTQLCAA
eukprot:TRINITY_DN5587_c0_g1_i1.p1 TRINITY_DN5587_c0_g1~~TRINITY_DN5587_c0_g1_i1.p1  ORF type:complete len:391 (-),score=79.93 TRINITY_DN5587_c0_g1_i1:135-1307(-)